MRACHVLGDQPSDAAERFAPPFVSAGRAANVLLGDAPLRTRSRERLEVDPELLRDLAHDGRRTCTRLGCRRCGWLHRLVTVPLSTDHHQHGPDGNDLALLDEDAAHRPRGRGGDLDRRLVRLDLDERVVLGDLLSLGDEPAGDLTFGQTLAEVGKLELVRHAADSYLIAPSRRLSPR